MSSCSRWKWLFPVVPFSLCTLSCCVCLGCALFIEEGFFLGGGALFAHDISAILCVCVTLRLLSSSIFNWIVWFCFFSLIMIDQNILVGSLVMSYPGCVFLSSFRFLI